MAAPQKIQKGEKVSPVILEVTDQMPAVTWQNTSAEEVKAVAMPICEIYHICISFILKHRNRTQVIIKSPKEIN